MGAVARQAEQTRLSGLLLAVRARVLEGHTLATALGDFPGNFPGVVPGNVAAGERSKPIWMWCSSGWPITPKPASRCARKSG